MFLKHLYLGCVPDSPYLIGSEGKALVVDLPVPREEVSAPTVLAWLDARQGMRIEPAKFPMCPSQRHMRTVENA